jgi:hypothetical protein
MLAGTLGLPFAGLVSAAYNSLLSTPDQPVDMLADYRNWLADIFGKEAGEVIAHGGLSASGLDFASHLDFANIVPMSQFLNDRRQVRDRLDSGALSMMGPTVGAAAGLVQGVSEMSKGEYIKGLQHSLPTFLKAPVKGFALAKNGATDAQGNKLPIEIDGWDVAAQSLNFTPTKLAEQREAQRSVNTTTALIRQRSSDLQNKFAKAAERQDGDELAAIVEQITEFNKANPDFAIRNLASLMHRRATERAVAAASGSAVEGRARQLPRIQQQTRFANVEGLPELAL